MPIRLLIIDDSALMRQLLQEILSQDDEIEVVGTAADPLIARQKIKALNPDVLTLDVEMPRMDGLEFLNKVMTLRPMPVVMVSSLTAQGAEVTLRALEMGALDFVTKPTQDLRQGMQDLSAQLRAKVKAAATARVAPRRSASNTSRPARSSVPFQSTEKIIAIGASTGGVEAVREIVEALPPNAPAVFVTQHMPPRFTSQFANRLNGFCAVNVQEARDGERAIQGHVYIAPGDRHLTIARSGAHFVCRLDDGPPVTGHKPSVDVLFKSAAQAAGRNVIGAILTGMGKDGAAGMLAMREAGALTFGQDEASCVVYGMPKAAAEIGAVTKQVNLTGMANVLLEACTVARSGNAA